MSVDREREERNAEHAQQEEERKAERARREDERMADRARREVDQETDRARREDERKPTAPATKQTVWRPASAESATGILIDLLRGRLHVAQSLSEVGGRQIFGPTKNSDDRWVVLPLFLRQLLQDRLDGEVGPEPDALVFTASNGSPMRYSNFRRYEFKPAIVQAGLPSELTVHQLRHTCAALMIKEGAHPEALKRHLGHSSIRVTMDYYGHLYPSEAEALADRMDTAYHTARADKPRTIDSIEAADGRA